MCIRDRITDPYIYKPDSIMLDLEDAVAEKEKDAARFSLYHALREINYRGIECIVRINGLDSELWKEDIRCAVDVYKRQVDTCWRDWAVHTCRADDLCRDR